MLLRTAREQGWPVDADRVLRAIDERDAPPGVAVRLATLRRALSGEPQS